MHNCFIEVAISTTLKPVVVFNKGAPDPDPDPARYPVDLVDPDPARSYLGSGRTRRLIEICMSTVNYRYKHEMKSNDTELKNLLLL